MPRPLDQPLDLTGSSLEHRLDPAVGKVAHPPAHTVLLRELTAGVTEEDALHPASNDHSAADHNQTLRPNRPVAEHIPRCRAVPAAKCPDTGMRAAPAPYGR